MFACSPARARVRVASYQARVLSRQSSKMEIEFECISSARVVVAKELMVEEDGKLFSSPDKQGVETMLTLFIIGDDEDKR